MKEKIKKYLVKYLPDTLFLTGVWIATHNLLRSPVETSLVDRVRSRDLIGYKGLGIMLIALALDIAVRRYFARKSSGE